MSFFIYIIATKATTTVSHLCYPEFQRQFLLILLLLKQQLQKSPLLFKMFIEVRRTRNCGMAFCIRRLKI